MTTKLAFGGAALVLVAMANGVWAGEAVLNRNDINANPSAFNGLPAYWTPNVNPTSAEGQQTDFIVKNGLALRTPDGNVGAQTFKGKSLTLGASDKSSAGSIAYKSNGFQITIPNLIVHKGSISSATSFFGGGYNMYWSGNATLYTTSDDPFVIAYNGSIDKGAAMDFALTGDETTAIRLSGAKKDRLVPRADQSKTYSGSWIFGAGQYIYIDGGWKKNNVTVFTSSQTVFGKPLTVFNPKSIYFEDGCSLRYEATGKKLAATDNRGITIADGGALTWLLLNAITIDCGYPIAGRDTTVSLSGNGTLKLRTDCTAKIVVGSSTSLSLAGSAQVSGGIEVVSGHVVMVGEAATDRVTANGAKLEDAVFSFKTAADGSDAAQLRLSGTLDITGKTVLNLSDAPEVAAEIPVLVIDKDVTREFTSDDFSTQTPNVQEIVVSRNENGDQVVSLRVVPYVYSRKNVDWRKQLNNGGHWSDGKIPNDPNQTYVIWDGTFVTGYADRTTVSVPGHWVLNTSAMYMCKEEKMTFEHLLMLNDSLIQTGQGASWTMTWAGDYEVRTTPGHAVTFVNYGMRAAIVSANISGRGAIKGVCAGTGTYAPYYLRFTGDNSGYVGTFAVSTTSGTAESPAFFEIKSETSLGGNPSAFAADAFRLGSFVQLNPMEGPITIDDANRGVTLETNSVVNADTGKDVTIKTPVVFKGAFTKVGAGTFAFGAGGVTMAADAAISVKGGALKPENVNALKGAAVSFADGAVLAFDAAVGAVDLTTTTLSKAGDKYLVRIDELQNEAAVATFASAQAAADFVANAKTVRGTAHKGYLFADGATVKAGVSGFSLIVR